MSDAVSQVLLTLNGEEPETFLELTPAPGCDVWLWGLLQRESREMATKCRQWSRTDAVWF